MTETAADVPHFPVRRDSPFEPPAEYAQWRETEPVKKVELPDGSNAWVLTRHEDARTLLLDLDLTHLTANRLHPDFPHVKKGKGVVGLSVDSMLLFMDEPEHGRIRRMLSPSFSAKTINAMRPGIQKSVDEVLDRMLESGGPVDLNAAFSLPIPTLVICQLLGLSYDHHEAFQELTADMLSLTKSREDFVTSLDTLEQLVQEAVREKDKDPSPDDLIGRMILEHVRNGDITHQQVVGLSIMLLVAGHETTANSISMGVVHLLSEPEKWSALRENRSLLVPAIEEMLRIHSITDLSQLRLAAKDFEIGGCPIKAGDGLIAPGAAANHDPAAFPDPDVPQPGRAGGRNHIAFGYGVHACIGQSLARAELEIVFTTLLDRVPTLELAVPVDELEFKTDSFVFGVYGVPVSW